VFKLLVNKSVVVRGVVGKLGWLKTPNCIDKRGVPDTTPLTTTKSFSCRFQAQQELVRSREEIQDLKEKLETIKIKRAKDQEKIKEYEKIR